MAKKQSRVEGMRTEKFKKNVQARKQKYAMALGDSGRQRPMQLQVE